MLPCFIKLSLHYLDLHGHRRPEITPPKPWNSRSKSRKCLQRKTLSPHKTLSCCPSTRMNNGSIVLGCRAVLAERTTKQDRFILKTPEPPLTTLSLQQRSALLETEQDGFIPVGRREDTLKRWRGVVRDGDLDREAAGMWSRPGREASACDSERSLFFLLPPRWQDFPLLQYLLNTHLIFLPKAQQQCDDMTCGCDRRVLTSLCQQPPHIDCVRS